MARVGQIGQRSLAFLFGLFVIGCDGAPPMLSDLSVREMSAELDLAHGCFDGVSNGSESDVDCGGSCNRKCQSGQKCNTGNDCMSALCVGGLCVSCNNNTKDGNETDVDCGGPTCGKCNIGQKCNTMNDCVTGLLCRQMDNVCSDADCANGKIDITGGETDIDCGGPKCPRCKDGKICTSAGDCKSLVCTNTTCAAPTCNDKQKNGSETDVDCGSACPKCIDGELCATSADCTSNVCKNGVCALPGCNDGTKNGTETDIDCGGSCPRCRPGSPCNTGSDCDSFVCTGNVCTLPRCDDKVKNGSETDVDCGGAQCMNKCLIGKKCNYAYDCTSGWCDPGLGTPGLCSCQTYMHSPNGSNCFYPRSCKDYLNYTDTKTVSSGVLPVDPDGPGIGKPIYVACQMGNFFGQGGGWTRVLRQNVVSNAPFDLKEFIPMNQCGSYNEDNPSASVYSILARIDLLNFNNPPYDLLYVDGSRNRYVRATQTWSPRATSQAGKCPAGFALVASNFTPKFICGWTITKVFDPSVTVSTSDKACLNGYAPDLAYAVGQVLPYSNYPLVCTQDGTGSACRSVEFYIR